MTTLSPSPTAAPTPAASPTSSRPVQIPAQVAQWLRMALAHAEAGRIAEAIEHLAGAAVVDIQQHQQTFLAGAFECAFIADQYEQTFARAGIERATVTPRTSDRPLRLLYILGSVVAGQAACANVARFIAMHDRRSFECAVLVTEELTQRTPPLQALRHPAAPSDVVGAEFIAAMRAAGAKVEIIRPDGTFLDGGRSAIAAARSLQPDIAVFVGSPACPIQAIMAYARVAPTQVNMCIGVPLLVRGMDAVIYNNPRRQHADLACVAQRGIGVFGVATSGGDAASGADITPLPRARLGLPADAVVLVSAANSLPDRMTRGTFAADLAALLASEPHTWWVGVGRGDFTAALEPLRRAGVADRAVLTGPAADIRPIIRAGDIMLNEYPEGGGNSVIEAMGCGLPVAAMAAGSRHAECIGAELVGPPWAIDGPDTATYWQRVRSWIRDAAARKTAGSAMQQRAIATLDYTAICRQYEACYLAAAGRTAKPAAA